ncbi:MAG: hypothetical protein HY556_04995 [Euryarchaeota archaeon]|nr:hypothetical protein [Euryarchaeota archaeon]
MATIHLTPPQESLTRALVACGYYGNQSEVGRAAFDAFLQGLSSARKREVALYLYKHGEATVSRFAEVANIPLHEARALLREEGLLTSGRDAPAAERRERAKKGASKFR